MREWEVTIEGDGPAVDAGWAAVLADALVPYEGVVSTQGGAVQAQLRVRTREANRAARVALEIWYAMRRRARLTALTVTQVPGSYSGAT